MRCLRVTSSGRPDGQTSPAGCPWDAMRGRCRGRRTRRRGCRVSRRSASAPSRSDAGSGRRRWPPVARRAAPARGGPARPARDPGRGPASPRRGRRSRRGCRGRPTRRPSWSAVPLPATAWPARAGPRPLRRCRTWRAAAGGRNSWPRSHRSPQPPAWRSLDPPAGAARPARGGSGARTPAAPSGRSVRSSLVRPAYLKISLARSLYKPGRRGGWSTTRAGHDGGGRPGVGEGSR
jgi:hypothetical protein